MFIACMSAPTLRVRCRERFDAVEADFAWLEENAFAASPVFFPNTVFSKEVHASPVFFPIRS